MALSAAHTFVGNEGLYGVALISGLTDMDAITLSTARLVELGAGDSGIEPAMGWRLIVVASMANHLFKWIICFFVATRRMAWLVALMFAAPITAGGVLLCTWP
jgi:uncharacterized membrane protein (DUF4010 family)